MMNTPGQFRSRTTLLGNGEVSKTESVYEARPEREARPEPSSSSLGRTPVRVVMTSHVICASPNLSLAALEGILLERNISGVPVVVANGRPLGMVSKTDLVRREYEVGETSSTSAAT